MTDGQWLFVTFLALYFIECLRWWPPQTLLIHGNPEKRRLAFRRPLAIFSIAGRCPLLLPWLPPFPVWQAVSAWRLIPERDAMRVKADGVRARDELIPWERLALSQDAERLRLAAGVEVIATCEAEATALRALCESWQNLPATQRGAAFADWALSGNDTDAFLMRLSEARELTRGLRLLGGVIWVWCYAGISLIYWRLGEGALLYASLVVLGGLLLAQALLFRRVCKKRAPAHTAPAYWPLKMLGMMFFPPMAIRAADHLLMPDAPPFHPLAAMSLLPEGGRELARHWWREARYLPGWSQPDRTPGSEEQALRTLFAANEMDLNEVDPPPPNLAVMKGCPRCHAAFDSPQASHCQDCSGVELAEAGSRWQP